MIVVWESDTDLRYLLDTSFKLPNRTNAFSILGKVTSQAGTAITKASFRIINIWLRQRKFPFKIS